MVQLSYVERLYTYIYILNIIYINIMVQCLDDLASWYASTITTNGKYHCNSCC